MPLSFLPLFSFNHSATPDIYTLSLHDALPISISCNVGSLKFVSSRRDTLSFSASMITGCRSVNASRTERSFTSCLLRSEEHTSELQSQSNLVCRLLLEKKKNTALQIRSEENTS